MYDLIVIGAGPAGMNAAIYASRAGLSVAILESGAPGGKLMTTAEIENWIGIKKITGPDLAVQMFEHATHFGANYLYGDVVDLIDEGQIKKVLCQDGTIYEARAIVIATGTRERKIGIPGEEAFFARGVSYCAVCDGAFFKDEPITVIGGGNSALEEADYLTRFGSIVNLVIRRDVFRAEKYVQERVLANPKIKVYRNKLPKAILGDKKVKAIELEDALTHERMILNTEAVFPFVGLDASTDFAKNLGILDQTGYILVDQNQETSVKGIFAAGDVCVTTLRQIATAVGAGAIAGQKAAHYINLLNESNRSNENAI